jgi:putative membrane protein
VELQLELFVKEQGMFIDFVALMLINLVAGLFLLAFYVYRGIDDPDQRHWAPGFVIIGFVSIITGFAVTFTWPLPGSYNIAFGELSVFFGALFLGTGFTLALGWDLFTVAIYAFFVGIASVIVGIQVAALGLTKSPPLSAAGFILSGLGGILAAPAFFYWRNNRTIRLAGAILLVVAGLIWAFTGYAAYWSHLSDFAKYVPPTLKP